MNRPFTEPNEIRDRATALGFSRIRFCDAGGAPGIEGYEAMIQAGRHGTMGWMARSTPPRANPETLLPGLTSAIVLCSDYAWPLPPDPGGLTGQVSSYAWGRDYHNLIGKRLRKYTKWLRNVGISSYAGIDSRPIIERAWATRAGVGYAAKNCCTISPGQGSLFFIAVVFVNIQLPPDPSLNNGLERYCGSCSRCIEACPTDAFIAPGEMDAGKCISYLNIEHKGPIPHHLRSKMGRWVFGCDACQTVCPHNHSNSEHAHLDFAPRTGHAWLDLEWVLHTDDTELDRFFTGSPIRRCKPEGLKRNACIVLGNIGDIAARPALLRASQHTSETIREAATWALDRL